MAKSFVITTTATEPLRADASGHAKAVFTVTNTTARVVRGLAKAKPLGDTKREWLTLEGEAERDFPARGTHQFTVNFNGPATASGASTAGAPQDGATPPAKYAFRLDIESAQDPDEDFAESPTVMVELMAPAKRNEKKFPWWLLLIILGGLLFIGLLVLIVALVVGGGNDNDNENSLEDPSPVASATETPTPLPSPSPSPTPTESPETACYNLVQGQIAWDYDGSKAWYPDNAKKLCAGTLNPSQPGQCYHRVMFGGVQYVTGGDTRWYPLNALQLCAGTSDANSRISCFQEKIARRESWQSAIEVCKFTR